MPLFDFQLISEIYDKALQLGLAAKRSALLAGIEQTYIANLETNPAPAVQMLLDLRALNSTDRIVGQEIPLKMWFDNAALMLLAQPDENHYFVDLRDRTIARREPSIAEAQQRAETTLSNLQEIAGKNTPLRDSLVAAGQEFDEIARTVRFLVVYKGLHDILHEVQVYSLPLMAAMLRRGMTTDDDWLMFQQQVSDLEFKHSRGLNEVRRLTEGSNERTDEEAWLVGLAEVHNDLKQAMTARSADQASGAIVYLRRLVGKKMSDLNLLLYYSARGLRIEILIDHLRAFAASLEAEDARAGQLREAATQLLLLKAEIEGLLKAHNDWQRIDDDLFAAEDALVFGGEGEMVLRNFSLLWPRVIDRLARFAGTGADPWYVRTQEHVAAFGSHCPMPATAPIAPVAIYDFREFLKVTRDQFFLVDKELKVRCDRLAEVADPIEKLARLP